MGDPVARALEGDPAALARVGVVCTGRDKRRVMRLTRRVARRMRMADWLMTRANQLALRAQRILLGQLDGD